MKASLKKTGVVIQGIREMVRQAHGVDVSLNCSMFIYKDPLRAPHSQIPGYVTAMFTVGQARESEEDHDGVEQEDDSDAPHHHHCCGSLTPHHLASRTVNTAEREDIATRQVSDPRQDDKLQEEGARRERAGRERAGGERARRERARREGAGRERARREGAGRERAR